MRRSTSLSVLASPRAVEPNNIMSAVVFSFQVIIEEASVAISCLFMVLEVNACSEAANLLMASRIRLLLLE